MSTVATHDNLCLTYLVDLDNYKTCYLNLRMKAYLQLFANEFVDSKGPMRTLQCMRGEAATLD